MELCGRSKCNSIGLGTQGLPCMGARSEHSVVLPHVLCAQPDARIHQRRKVTEAWENLRMIFTASTTTQKLHLRQELNNIQQRDMSVTDYTTKMKEIYDVLGSINVTIDEDKMVRICLGDLAHWYRPILTGICTREKPLSLFDLLSMLMVEENHTYGPRGCGEQSGSAHNASG